MVRHRDCGHGYAVHLLNIGLYPWWSLVIIAINLLVLFGLTVHWKDSSV